MIPTAEQIAELERHFQLCEFPADPICESCEAPVEDGRTWFEKTSYEYDEGEYYCSKCGLERIKWMTAFYEDVPDELPEGPCATCKGEQDWPDCGGPDKECPIVKLTEEKKE